MKIESLAGLVACILIACFSNFSHAAEAPTQDAEAARIENLVKHLDDSNASKRAAAETELRNLEPKALPVLAKCKLENEESHLRLRGIVVDLTLEHAKSEPEDGQALSSLAREEALSKRYANALKCYRRAEQVYGKLKDQSSGKKNKQKKDEYKELQKKALERAERAENLAKGKTFTGVDTGIVKIGVDRDTRDDDW